MRPDRPARQHGTAVALTLALLGGTASCAPRAEPTASNPPSSALPGVDGTRWVTIYDPQRASNGYTLDLYQRRIPILFDMNGRIVHAWPRARVRSRARLLSDGSLLGIALGRAVVEYDWDGNLAWEHGGDEILPHHDVIRLANGNTMLLVSSADRRTDDLLEVDRAGKLVWSWHSARRLAWYWQGTPLAERGEITHINSVQELPDNRLFAAGDERFRPGNLLLSARNLNAVFVVDRLTGEVVWTYDHELDLQHEALMIPPGFFAAGRIQLFDNGYRSRYRYRKSVIREIEPDSGDLVWFYSADELYSPTGGVEQPLPNGNVLIGSTRGGRAFEVTREGEIVWQWVPPVDPVRPHRYAYDHAPQLADLPRPAQRPVRPAPGYRHVDSRLYQFASGGELRKVVLDGRPRTFLARNNDCRKLLLPGGEPTLTIAYGLDKRALRRQGRERVAVRFGLRLKGAGDGAPETLLDDTVDLAGGTWRGWTLDLGPHALRWVDLCVSAEETGEGSAGEPTESYAFWENPAVRPAAAPADTKPDLEPLTPEELEVRQQHLRTLGYVD